MTLLNQGGIAVVPPLSHRRFARICRFAAAMLHAAKF
jgi:hypothetical protein